MAGNQYNTTNDLKRRKQLMKMIMIPHPFDNDYDTIIQNARNVMSDEAFEAFKLGLACRYYETLFFPDEVSD